MVKTEGGADAVIFYATKETMQRYKLKAPDQLKAEIAPYAQAVVQSEQGNRLYEWGCKLFTSTEENVCRLCISKPNW